MGLSVAEGGVRRLPPPSLHPASTPPPCLTRLTPCSWDPTACHPPRTSCIVSIEHVCVPPDPNGNGPCSSPSFQGSGLSRTHPESTSRNRCSGHASRQMALTLRPGVTCAGSQDLEDGRLLPACHLTTVAVKGCKTERGKSYVVQVGKQFPPWRGKI